MKAQKREEWKVVNEAPLYEVSTFGNVRTIKTGKLRNLRTTERGYNIITLVTVPKVSISRRVHRLVAEAFIPKPKEPFDRNGEPRNQVDHKDMNTLNNTVGNLQWVSNTENMDLKMGIPLEERIVQREKLAHEKQMEQKKRALQILEEKRVKREAMPYGSQQAMLVAIGKPVTVQGVVYPSCGQASQWIVDGQAKLGITRNKDTISKEIRKFVAGKRSAWTMYNLYSIGS